MGLVLCSRFIFLMCLFLFIPYGSFLKEIEP